MFYRPFSKFGVVPLAAYMCIYMKGDIIDIRGMGAVQKCYHGKAGRVSSVIQHAIVTVLTNKSKILAKKINIHVEHIKHRKS